MARNNNRRRRSRAIVKSDTFAAFAVPIFCMGAAGYQLVVKGEISNVLIGVLLIFGLAGAGWRIDVFFDTYMRAKYGGLREEDPPPEMPARKPRKQLEQNNDNKDDDGDEA